MICPRCGTWIDAGEPYCPGCMWDGSDDVYYDDDYFESRNAQVTYDSYNFNNRQDSRHSDYGTENSSNQYTHTINNNTGKFENEKSTNTNSNELCDPFTCCCGGIILLWILGTLSSLLGL